MSTQGTLVDGLGATEAIDLSGEKLIIEGCDISSLEAGEGTVTYEHRGDDSPGASPDDIIGKILYAKKLLTASDCSNAREKFYWDSVELPCIYFVARLYDAAGSPGAVAAAAQFRDHAANKEKQILRWSVEGNTLKTDPKDEKILKITVIRRITCTQKPCNHSAISGLLLDGSPPEGFEANPENAPEEAYKEFRRGESTNPLYRILGSHQVDDGAILSEEQFAEVKKTITAGSYNAAPSTLTGGAALQREFLIPGVKNRIKSVYKNWKPEDGPLREVLKHQLPEASPEYLDRFADAVETHRLTRAEVLLGKSVLEDETDLKKKQEDGLKPPPHSMRSGGEGQLTVRGKPAKASNVTEPTFDEVKGVLHTPRGSVKMYVPSDDHPKHREAFHAAMSDPKGNEIFSRAASNWRRVNGALKAGRLPEEVPMHAALFSHLSPNTPVPYQELMYSVHQDTTLVTCDGQSKRIADFSPGDSVLGVDEYGDSIRTEVVALHDHGVLMGFEAVFDDGYRIVCSKNHKFLTRSGMMALWRIVLDDLEVLCESASSREWLAGAVRPRLQNGDGLQGPQEGLLRLQGDLAPEEVRERTQVARAESGSLQVSPGEDASIGARTRKGESSPGGNWYQALGEGEARGVQRSPGEGCSCDAGVAGSEPRQIQGSSAGTDRGGQEVARRESGGVRREYQEDGGRSEDQEGWISLVKGGDMASSQQYPVVERRSNKLSHFERRGAKAGGLRLSGSQGLGGSGWVLPLLRSEVLEEQVFGERSGAGYDAERGGPAPRGCYANPDVWGVFRDSYWEAEGRVAQLAHSDAPLASTRGLVLRRIVRVRAVGECRMYDLEVSHLKHNFLLPNGVVTSNSHLVDAMNHAGMDARDPDFAQMVGPDWKGRDNPRDFPQTGAAHFGRIGQAVQIKNDSKTTGRLKGDIGSFMLADNKLKNMGQYAAMHAGLVALARKHGPDMRSAARELMEHKVAYGQHEEKRKRALASGNADPGGFQGIPVAGLAPKTARYMYGMMGGSNGVVPDTHFIRYLFGLDRDKDSPTIDYLKSVLWNERNAKVLEGIDRHYAKRHDAVKHLLEQPEWQAYKGNPESVVFPAFWRNWMAIVPHENARGMTTHGFNEGTDHMPYWEAIAPILKRYHIPGSLAKSEGQLGHIAQRTAGAQEEIRRQFGEVPATLAYWAYLVPHLMGDQGSAVQKMEAWSVDLRKAAAELQSKFGELPPHPDHLKSLDAVKFGEKRVNPGHAVINGKDHYTLLDAGDHGYTAVPYTKVVDGDWGAHDMVTFPRGTKGLVVDRDPETLDAGQKVDSAKHGHVLNMKPEQHKLIHGLDFAAKRTGESTGYHAANRSHWRKGPTGPVFIKSSEKEESEFNEAHREVAYHNLARDFFGLGGYVPTTALVRHPRTGRDHAVIERVKGHPAGIGPRLESRPDRATIKNLGDSGELDKLGVMNMVLGNSDRHGLNYMFDLDGGIKLIDHGLTLHSDIGSMYKPDYWKHHEAESGVKNGDSLPLNPAAVEWLNGLDPAKLDESLKANGVPDEERAAATYRLNNLKAHVAERPTMSRAEVANSPLLDHANGVRFGAPIHE